MSTEIKWPAFVQSVQHENDKYLLALDVGESVVVYGVNGSTRVVANDLAYDGKTSRIAKHHIKAILAAVAEGNQ